MPGTVSGLLANLVAIDSVNPDLVPGAAGEAALARFVADWLGTAGFSTALEEALPGRPNVIARLDGSGPGPTLMWNAHLDTVGVHDMTVAPFDARIEGDRLYGRGSADTKAGLAAMMVAGAALAARRDWPGSLLFCGVVDEEYLSVGTEHCLARHRADACVVAEDTALDLVLAHQGFGWYEIEVTGRAAHGMHPDEGIDAIAMAAGVLADLERFDREVLSADVHPLAGKAVFHNSTIRGGTEYGIYPDRCVLGIEIGCNPGMAMRERRAQLEALLARRAAAQTGFSARLKVIVEREAFAVDVGHPIVASLQQAAAAVGRHAARRGMNAWMDAALIEAAGIPTVVFGPGGQGHHAAVEWVDLTEAEAAADILAGAARSFLSGAR